MKLHLPVGLRVALLAVLVSLSVAFGKVTVKQNISDENPDGEKVEAQDGVITKELKKDVSVTLTSEGGEKESLTLKGSLGEGGTTRITVNKNCDLTLNTYYASYVEDDYGSVVTDVTVDGGTFTVGNTTTSNLGYVKGKESKGDLTINVTNGGEFRLAKYSTVGRNDTLRGENVVKINVSSGGTFINEGGSISEANGGNASPSCETIINISTDGTGGTFEHNGNLSKANNQENGSSEKLTINVGANGIFNTPNSLPAVTIGDARTGHSSLELAINVEKGGTFTCSTTGGTPFEIATAWGGDVHATADITVSGEFNLKNTHLGRMQVDSVYSSYALSSCDVTIKVVGGTFTMQGSNSTCTIGCFQKNLVGGDVTTDITISGETGAFNLEGGRIGGYLDTNSQKNKKGEINVAITLRDKGKMSVGEKGQIDGDKLMIDLYDKSTFTVNSNAKIADTAVFTMHGGSLAGEGIASLQGKVAIDTASGFTGTIDLGGLDASRITQEFTRKVQNADTGEYTYESVKGFRIGGADTHITGLKAGTTLTLSGANGVDGYDNSIMVGSSGAWLKTSDDASSMPSGKEALIKFQGDVGKGEVSFTEGSKFFLNLVDADLVKELLKGQEPHEVSFQVYFTNGNLSFSSGDVKDYFTLGAGWGLQVEGYEMMEDGGVLTIKGKTNIGLLSGGKDDPSLEALSKNEAVIVTDNATLESTAGGTLNHLTGSGDLTITGKGEVNLENNLDEFGYGDSELTGKLTADPDVGLHKTGSEKLTLSGGLEAKGDLTVDEGTLTLTGDDNSIGGELTLGKDGHLQVDGQLTLSGKSDLSEAGDNLSGNGKIVVDDGGSLTLNSDMLTADGLPAIDAKAGSTLEFADTDPVDFDLVKDMTCTVAGDFTSTGDATFSGSVKGELTVQGGSLNMSNTENGLCDLYVVGEDTQATIAAGSKYNSITVGDNAQDNDKLVVSANEENGKAGAGIKVKEDIVFRRGAETDFTLNLNDPDLWGSGEHDATMLSTERTIYIEQGTTFVIDCLESNLSGTHNDLRDVVILEGTNIENPEAYNAPITTRILVSDALSENTREGEKKKEVKADVRLGTILDQLYENVKMTQDGQKVYINADARTESPWMTYATTDNSGAGLNLLWKALSNAGGAVDPQVEGMFHALQNLLNESPAEARRVMAAVAGSTLTSVSAAQSAALRNQMGRVRDHALQAARLRCAGNADEATAQQRPCKNSHVWVEGTGFFSEQHSVGDESGYRLNSWGGAVGIDAQVDAHWSVGVSLSASYGDLEAHAADDAKGDLDTYTVSFWSQAKNGRWGNTLLFTLGTNEADLKRTVNYGAGSYTATSNASGSSLGAMWELTYDFHPVKDNKSNILQPLFNVAVMHTSMDGFSEKNAGNVGLAAEKQTRDTMTLGLGLRWLAAINSAKAVNRTVSTEVHANVAQDLGDRRSVANVALLADPNLTQRVYGSKTGSTAFQFGAGVNVPMTPNSQIYVNAGGELREHANAWNAALGVRMGF